MSRNKTPLKTKSEKEEFIKTHLDLLHKNDKATIRQVLEIFSDEIYSFPIRYYQFNQDQAGDFYIMAYEHFYENNKLASYIGKSSFYTWLYSVLRNLTIDFIRTNHIQLRTVSLIESADIEDPKDTLYELGQETHSDIFQSLNEKISSLNIKKRIIFKLTYIFFFKLSIEELDWLFKHSPIEEEKIINIIVLLRDKSADKVLKIRPIEDNITRIYQKILFLTHNIQIFFHNNPFIPNEPNKWSEEYTNEELPDNITYDIQQLVKRRKQHITLIEQHRKKLLAIKAPLIDVANLLGETPNNISTQLMRLRTLLNDIFS